MTIEPRPRRAAPAAPSSSTAAVAAVASHSWPAPPPYPWWRRHPLVRLLCSFRVRVVAVLTLGFVAFFAVAFLALSATFDEHEAARRALRSFVADAPAPRGMGGAVSLEERRHEFEAAVGAVLLRLPPVTRVVDELVRRVLRLVEAVADRSVAESVAEEESGVGSIDTGAASGADGLSHRRRLARDRMVRFTFGTKNRAIAGAVGFDVHALRMVVDRNYSDAWRAVHAPPSMHRAPSHSASDPVPEPGSEPDLDLDAPNLREKLTAIYVATMQVAGADKEALLGTRDQLTAEEIRFYSLQHQHHEHPTDGDALDPHPESSGGSDPVPAPLLPPLDHPAIFPLSLLLGRELGRWKADPLAHEAWAREQGVVLDVAAIAEQSQREIEEGSVHLQHWHHVHAHADTDADGDMGAGSAPSARKCFLPLFVPEGPVRHCRCIDTRHEHTKGCRKARGHTYTQAPTQAQLRAQAWHAAHTTAASVLTPPLSRRELRFALPESAEILSEDDSGSSISGAGGGDGSHLSPSDRLARHRTLLFSPLWHSTPLPWVPGAHVFEEPSSDSDNGVFQQLRSLGGAHGQGMGAGVARFVAGPSSTTWTVLQLARFVGMGSPAELALLRLALVAYLVAGRDHSLLEVLVGGGEWFGLGPSMRALLAAAEEEAGARSQLPAMATRYFATALPFTHLLPEDATLPSYCAEGGKSNGSGENHAPRMDVARLHNAIAHELLESHAPPSLLQEARNQMRADTDIDVDSGTDRGTDTDSDSDCSASCSTFVASHWRLLGLGELHARHCAARFPDAEARRSESAALHHCADDDGRAHSCHPTVMLQFLVRNLYSY